MCRGTEGEGRRTKRAEREDQGRQNRGDKKCKDSAGRVQQVSVICEHFERKK